MVTQPPFTSSAPFPLKMQGVISGTVSSKDVSLGRRESGMGWGGGGWRWGGNLAVERERERASVLPWTQNHLNYFYFEDDGFRPWPNLPTGPLSMHV